MYYVNQKLVDAKNYAKKKNMIKSRFIKNKMIQKMAKWVKNKMIKILLYQNLCKITII